MDSAAPAAAWVVLAAALPVLAVVGVALARTRPPRTGAAPAATPRTPAPARRWAQDDLPGFLEAPPGTPRPPAAPRPAVPAGGEDRDAGDAARTVAGLAAAALALVAALAVLALLTGTGDAPAAAPATSPPPAGPSGEPPARPAPRPPDLIPVPVDPLPGEQGAGLLATRSVPLGDDGASARLTLGGLVLERRAVGVTVTYPAVSVTTGYGVALAHVRLPVWNCLGSTAPEDPGTAGCTPAGTEYADLPTPALTVTREGDALRVTGRFPTYTRPAGTPPAYTGRVYDLRVTVTPAGPLRDGEAVADGALFLGTERADAVDDPALNRIRVAG